MRLGKNLLAGFANSVTTALVTLAVIPFYLKYLGIEAYGIVGFFVTMQAMFQVLDLGLAPTINREVARCSTQGDTRDAGQLLRTLAMLYWSMAMLIAIAIFLLAPFIAKNWLQAKSLSLESVSSSMMLMGFVIALRWPIGLYQAALMGAQRITTWSWINISMTILGGVGAVSVIALVSPSVQAFFIWQALVGLITVIIMRRAAWRVIGRSIEPPRFDVERLKRVWRFSAGMGAIAITTLVFMQLDKVLLSKILNLDDYGRYMIAVVVVGGLNVFTTPFFNALYPRFSALVASGDTRTLIELYRLSSRSFGIAFFPIVMALLLFSQNIVHIWTGNQDLASSIAPILSILVLGSALHGMMHFPYALQLAYGMVRIPLTINTILLIVMVPLITALALKYGAIGGAIAWLTLHILYLILGTWLTHRKLLEGIGCKWLFLDMGLPFMLSIVVGVGGKYVIDLTDNLLLFESILIIGGLMLLAAVLSIAVSPQLVRIVMKKRMDIRTSSK